MKSRKAQVFLTEGGVACGLWRVGQKTLNLNRFSNAPVAQLAEHLTLNQGVSGSNPGGGTATIKGFGLLKAKTLYLFAPKFAPNFMGFKPS